LTKSYQIEQSKKADKKALENWKQTIRQQVGNKCEVCNSEGILNVHHILPKERYQEFKIEPMNGVLLCQSHHKFGKISAHRNGIWFAKWLSEKHPDKYKWAQENL
jgi:hypothetical protein